MRLAHGEHDPRDAQQIADELAERCRPRRCEDQPATPWPDNLHSRFEERHVILGHFLPAKHAESDSGHGVENDGSNGNAAQDGEGNGPPRIFHFARHDGGAHEAIPGPEEDRCTGHEA